jgi:hypothetical protein
MSRRESFAKNDSEPAPTDEDALNSQLKQALLANNDSVVEPPVTEAPVKCDLYNPQRLSAQIKPQ